jgi:hypothetical protein
LVIYRFDVEIGHHHGGGNNVGADRNALAGSVAEAVSRTASRRATETKVPG